MPLYTSLSYLGVSSLVSCGCALRCQVVDTEESLFLERVDIEKALRIYLKELARTSQMQHVGPMIAPIVQAHILSPPIMTDLMGG